MSRTGTPGDVGISGEGMENQHGVGFVLIELAEGFIGEANVGQRVAVFGVPGAQLEKLSIPGVITIAPRTTDRWRATKGCVHSLRHESRR